MKEYPIEEEFLRPGETLGNNGLCCLSNTNLSLLHIANAIGLGVYITSNGINDKTLRGREGGRKEEEESVYPTWIIME